MSRPGQARTDLILAMIPPGALVIDVGADHGYVAASVDGIATERQPHRRGRVGRRWVITDGLAPFRRVQVAVIAGMGAQTIEGILARGPRPEVAILHAPDDPQRLRLWLAQAGYRIDAEGLAPEGSRFAEVIRAVPGTELSSGLTLAYGPRLLRGDSPWLVPHLAHHLAYNERLARDLAAHVPERAARFAERATFLERELRRLGGARP